MIHVQQTPEDKLKDREKFHNKGKLDLHYHQLIHLIPKNIGDFSNPNSQNYTARPTQSQASVAQRLIGFLHMLSVVETTLVNIVMDRKVSLTMVRRITS